MTKKDYKGRVERNMNEKCVNVLLVLKEDRKNEFKKLEEEKMPIVIRSDTHDYESCF